MAVSGKTAAPWEIPYYLSTDKPPDLAAVTKAIADRTHAVLPSGTLTDGRIVVVESGAAAFKAMSGDATIDKTGKLTIANDAVTAAKIAENAVGSSEIAADAVGSSEIADGGVTSREFKPTVFETSTGEIANLVSVHADLASAEVTPPVNSYLLMMLRLNLIVDTSETVMNVLSRITVDGAEVDVGPARALGGITTSTGGSAAAETLHATRLIKVDSGATRTVKFQARDSFVESPSNKGGKATGSFQAIMFAR
jgi:hypothetical protein